MSEAKQTTTHRAPDVMSPTMLTFVLKTHLPDRHPGVVQIQGRLGSAYHDIGGYQGILLYEGSPGEAGAAYHLASAIYDEETRLRQSSSLRDARFDFLTPCSISFFQKNESETTDGRPARKKEIGSLSLPGGQSREQICQAIAATILAGWEKPPETAYRVPEYLTSERGAIIYSHSGHFIEPLLAFSYNGHTLEGPLLFHAWSQGCVCIATLHLASEVTEELRLCYHICTLLQMDQGWLFCDHGMHTMDEPLTVIDRTMPKAPWYYQMSNAPYLPTIRDQEKLVRYWRWETPLENPLEKLSNMLQEATPGHSLFCPECQRTWLWETDERDLQALSADALLTLCPHYWYCSACKKWSGPSTPVVVYERSSCRHARPAFSEKRLALQDYRAATSWRGHRLHVPPAPFVRDIPLPGMVECEVLLTFLASWRAPGKGQTIPAGTRLVGIWANDQGDARDQYRIALQDEYWRIPATLVSVCCFLTPRAPRRKQFEVAQESLQVVATLEDAEDHTVLGEALERALFELSWSGALPADLASPTFRYARLLLGMGQQEYARETMERAVDYFIHAVAVPSPTSSPKSSTERKVLAINGLIALGNVYLQQGRAPEELIGVAKRLKSYEDDLKRELPEYRANLIEMRLFAALLHALGDDIKEATYLYRLTEALAKDDLGHDRDQYKKLNARVREVLYPEEGLLLQLQETLADIRHTSLDHIKEAEKTLWRQKRDWYDQKFWIYLRVKRSDQRLGILTLEENIPSYSTTQKLRGGSRFRFEDLERQGAPASATVLAETIYSDLESRNGKYHWNSAVDFSQETTITLFLVVEAEAVGSESRPGRYAYFPYIKCALPGRTSRSEAVNRLTEGLVEGLRLLERISNFPFQDIQYTTREERDQPRSVERASHEQVPQEDLPLLTRIQRYGVVRPSAKVYRDYARDILQWTRAHLSSGSGESERDCQFWKGETHVSLGRLSIDLVPREIVWAISRDDELPLTCELWPKCGHANCIRPDHQLEVIPITPATQELTTRVAGRENARYAIADAIQRGALPAQSGSRGEVALARSDFDAWRASPAFAEQYISGKNVPAKTLLGAAKKGQGGQQRARSLFEGLDGHRQAAVIEVWGGRGTNGGSEEALHIWMRQIRELSSARFVWVALSANECRVLWAVIEENAPTGSSRLSLLRRAGLAPDELDAALARLQFLLLLHVDYLLEEEIQQRIRCWEECEGALRRTGAEFFSSDGHALLYLVRHFESLSSPDLIALAQRYGISSSRVSSESALRRLLTEGLVRDPGRMFGELSQLDFSLQRLVACVYEHGGQLSVEEALAATGIERSDLAPLVQLSSALCLLFDTFVSGGKRLLYIPPDVYEASQSLSVAPRTLWQLDHFLEPGFIRDGQPDLLYDLAIMLWHVYHLTIEPTQDKRIPVRMAKKIIPYLHILPREEEGMDWRVELIDYLAWYWRLVKTSTIAELKPHYLPGEYLPLWANCDLVTQARLAFIWWLGSPEWVDLVAADCQTWDVAQEYEDARQSLILALQMLKPGQWYPTTAFLNILWERWISSKSSGSSTRSRSAASAQGPAYERWMRTDGAVYRSMLASTVHELGLVALGYHQPPKTTEARLYPDLLQLTELGKTVLFSKLKGFPPDEKEQDHEVSRSLIVQPNFEIMLLHPDMQALWSILPFVELLQIERVSKLRLDKAALHRGLAQGQNIDRIIEVLGNLSQKELPQNILYTLRDWASKHLSAQLSRVVLIEVPNEYVAQAMSCLAGFQELGIRQIAPCLFAVLDPTRLLDVRRFLLQNNISTRILE